MLKYRRIIAGILAVNLLAGSILLDYTEVNANNVNTSLNMISAENSDEVSHADAESVSPSEKTDEENKADEKNTTPDANEKDTASSNSDSDLTNETQEEESTKQEPSSEIAAEDASQQATEAEAQEISDTISLNNLKFYTDTTKTAEITSSQQLILLSHCAQSDIQNITININTTGELNLSTTIAQGTSLSDYLKNEASASQAYTYLGLGSAEFPFKGTITGQTPPIKTNTTLFRGISSNARIEKKFSVEWEWQGDGTKPMFAETYLLESDGTKSDGTIPITFTSGNGSLLGTVKKATNETEACLTIGNVVTYRDKVQAGSSTSNDNIGLICNTLESGTIKLDGYAFPTSTEINTGSGAAGGLIGKMEGGILNLTSIGGANISNLAVNSSSGSAGSIVGEMSETAQIQVNQNITITNPTIKGKYAGGFAGKIVNSTLSGNKKITINSPALSSGENKDSAVGGWIGDYIVRGNNHEDKTLPAQIDVVEPKVTMNGGVATNGGNAGGYFGVLELQGEINYQISGTEQEKKNITSEYTAGSNGAYGTIAGNVISNNKKSSLIINYVNSNSTTQGNSYYQGGLIGEIGEHVYLQVRNSEITVSNTTAKKEVCGFGGVVGHLSSNSIMSIADSVKVTISGTNTISGGGLVGNASSGSIIEISGTTDLSGVNYSASPQDVGQLVGMQDCALIFAHGDGNGNGWKYTRSNKNFKINDIGNYGEVIRLKANTTTSDEQGRLDSELLKIDSESHEIRYGTRVNLTGNDITISSKEDLALLSIAWNSRGVFSADSNLTTNNWTTLKSKNINFTADVNLQNTGIIGISRDIDDKDAYTGNINGNAHTLTLSIGETYGFKGENIVTNETEGCGKIYSSGSKHTDIGLFSRMRGNVSNLTITGSINAGVSNGNMWIGSIAARQENNETVISNVKVTTTIKFDTNNNSQISCIGGLFGSAAKVKLSENTGIQSNITLSNAGNGKQTYAGSVAGYMSAGSLECNGVTIGGEIVTDASKYAYVGGLVGFMPPDGSDKDTSTQVNIKALTFDGFSITASNAQTACGGLLGGVWARSAVTFASDNTATTTSCLTVNNATINAPKASVGGLAYKASGLWEIRSKGIDIKKLQIHCGEDLGLLVCHGEKRSVKFNNDENKDKEDGALYLRTTADWDDSYKLAEGLELTCGSKAVFDEFVAYTAASKDKIANNDENGIVSIATKDRSGVKEENNTCNTYQNRTNLGKNHKVNANSRYYYDLDEYTETAFTNNAGYNTGKIDTPEELVLWSCAVYANSNIKEYFYTFNNQEITDIKNNILNPTISDILNMDKYSYYPIHLNTGVGITDATITFYNEQIEKAEKNNKSTQATTQSQHYMMHCGLFLDHSVNETATSITLSNVTFAGSIGKVNSNASGVLFSGMVQGSESNGRQNTAKMNLKTIVLSGLKITDYTDSSYAPLLINQIGSYTKTEIKNLSTRDYTEGTAVASSLIGNAGSEDGHQINMGFSDIVLPDKPTDATKEEGIFTHATLLESYKYAVNDTSVATYNFYKSGDWEGATYKHQVTYGKEISDSTEYIGLQKWYYDIATYNKKEGLVKTESNQTEPVFSKWLPYVYVSYDENNHSHEIKVNQRVFDITEGCGTYGDPYVIKDAGEMEIISEYMRTKLPRTDWKITITNDQNEYCTDPSKDIIFRYNGEQWVQVEKETTEGTENWVDKQNGATRSNSFMQRYIANAYYDLQGTNGQITLNDFKGFGTTDNPFRGVLVSTNTNGVKLILTGANTGNGLIAYSYGSVVKNLTIRYEGEKKTLVYQKSSSVFYPTSCFGGAIGCILGGDNIIDGVNVTLADGWLTLSGANKHLLQVGGYVGSVCGGGVLFRNMQGKHVLTDKMISDGSVAETATSSLYVNPYVGRVLDGYAFADTAGENLNNTDKNYQIQNLNSSGTNDTKHITASGKSIGIKDAEGLLILSAIVNSGASSSGSSNAYRNITEGALQQGYAFGNGEYGKVRNAAYDSIGMDTQPGDFVTAVKDDRTAPSDSNTPVLITKYADKDLFKMAVLNARTGGATLTFPNNGTLDMSVYKSSYQGVSARYVSNAVTSKNEKTGKTETKAAGIVPLIQGVSGNGTKIIFDMNVKEYADDDFHAASVGGVFNLFAPVEGTCNVANLTFTGKAETASNTGKTGAVSYTGVQLQYYTSDGEKTEQASNWGNWKYVGVGSFVGSSAGTVAEFSGGYKWYIASVNFDSVKFENMTIQSPAVAGGLIGNSGRIELNKGNSTPTSDIGILLQPCGGNGGQNTVYLCNTFTNCSFRNLTVMGQEKAGGFCGYIDGKVNLYNQLNVTVPNVIIGQDSSISAIQNNSSAGGLFGFVRRKVAINDKIGTYTAIWKNVNVEAGQYSGDLIGEISADNNGGESNINNVQILESAQSKSASQAGGGVIGIAYGGKKITIKDCSVNTSNINASSAGGIVGNLQTPATITGCTVNASNIKASSSAGGIVGYLQTPATITGCTVSGSNTNNSKIEGNNCASGIVGFLKVDGQVAIRNNKVEKLSLTASNANETGWGSGGFIGDVSGNTKSSEIFIFDSEVTDCSITGNRAGGFAGTLRGCVKGSNLLLNNTQITASSDKSGGLLIGLTGDANPQPMTIAGVSIQNTTARENNRNISKLYGTLNETQNTDVKNHSYFSFADYNGTASNNTTQSLLDAEQVFPYVVTSPTSQLSVYDAANASKALYGDSAAWTKDADGKYTLNAQTIYQDAKNTQNSTAEGKYTYQEMGVEQFQFTKNISTYNKENQTNTVSNDFPVLVVSDNVSQTITDYLDIVTNGGYTRANNISGHVDASVQTYTDTGGKFVLATNPALEVKYASGRISEFAATTQYDNTQSRFTLLTVTFKEKDENDTVHNYNVQVPIIVRRMLEIGFTATLSSGTNYRATNYDLIEDKAHLLESTGNAFTAYLTYTYNSDDKGLYSEYGWNSYINAGGNVSQALDKSIDFQVSKGSSLPAGTQLSLIDCQDNSKVYYYTTDSNTGNTIPLTAFKDSSEKTFQAVSIGELMGVTATQDNNGSFIKVDAEGVPDGVTKEDGKTYTAPTVKIKTANGYEYYRKIETGESGTHYAVTVDESKLKDGVGPISTVHENYYLVITVADITNGTDLNGSVQTKITSNGIPFRLNYRTRKGKVKDTHESTASTYQISHGYEQTLIESEAVTGAIKKVTATDSFMAVDVVDKITIPSGQAFNEQDELYQKFSGSLIKTLKQENSQSTSAEVFPNGTTGTAAFYVYVMDGTTKKYYTYADRKWTEAGSAETKALEYEWTAINGLMDLPLSTNGTIDSSVNLQQIRDIVKDKQNEFYVEVKMNAKLPANGLDVIPESRLDNAVPTNYTKLTYTSQLATTRKSLSYSTARALLPNTKISYYRDEAAGVQLTFEADEIGQLGINLLDLQNSYLDAAKENTIIDTTARYDMSTIKDLSSILASSKGIQFSIQLQNKNTTQDTENYANALELEDYIKVSVKSENAGTVHNKAYTWTVPKSSYWDDDKKIMKASSIFDGDIMTQAIQLKVNIKNVDQLKHLYSNYRVVLSVGIIDQNGSVVENTKATDNIIYTMARVKPEFQDKQNTR
ncbi:hypothetical protein LQE94_10210 [Mediterraneibacter sp. NSJ-151]|uniref:hypothetical protein n=1 Tax=Mediterraneibacter sp. NSJ-151 TaxID=2897708 RepID=UPI001F0ACBB3|nr:hypothetical protein [Mediterraneibacter sp. NSJ-151]MCH4280387.1 hypothetical protein [Mediterraneibacter sp. NSJ-151]